MWITFEKLLLAKSVSFEQEMSLTSKSDTSPICTLSANLFTTPWTPFKKEKFYNKPKKQDVGGWEGGKRGLHEG